MSWFGLYPPVLQCIGVVKVISAPWYKFGTGPWFGLGVGRGPGLVDKGLCQLVLQPLCLPCSEGLH